METYIIFSSALFTAVGFLHLWRSISGWTLLIGSWAVPRLLSFGAGAMLLGLSAWGWSSVI